MAINIYPYLDLVYYGNSVGDYAISVGIFIISIILMRIFRNIIIRKLESMAKKTSNNIDDFIIRAIRDVGWPVYLIVAVYLGTKYIIVPPIIDSVIYFATILVGTFYISKAIKHFIDLYSECIVKKKGEEEGEVDTSILDLFKKILTALIWLAAFLFILASLGIDITGAIVGVGAGGIIIGFALQNVMSDLFASFSIYFDKPFRKGDFIIIGNDMGTVQKVGIMTTRIKTLQGQQLIVPNNDLVSSRINNYKRMGKRRVVITFGVKYQTTSKQMEKIPAIVTDILSKTEHSELNRVHFKAFGDSALLFEMVIYIDSGDYNVYMDEQQAILLELKKRLEKEKIEFAYPTQTIYVSKMK